MDEVAVHPFDSRVRSGQASYEWDAESDNDYAIARYYVNRLGRFMSPDLIAGDIGDPQSLNRYLYVLDDPINLTDPFGLQEGGRDREMDMDLSNDWGRCYLDGSSAPCGLVRRLLGSGVAFVRPSGPDWRPAGGRYRGSGCWVNEITEEFWCPNPFMLPRFGIDRDVPLPPGVREMAAQIVRQSGGVADPRFIAGWYVGSVAGRYAIPAVRVGWAGLSHLSMAVESTHPGVTVASMQFLQAAFTTGSVAPTPAGYAGFTVRVVRLAYRFP